MTGISCAAASHMKLIHRQKEWCVSNIVSNRSFLACRHSMSDHYHYVFYDYFYVTEVEVMLCGESALQLVVVLSEVPPCLS